MDFWSGFALGFAVAGMIARARQFLRFQFPMLLLGLLVVVAVLLLLRGAGFPLDV